MSEDARTNRPLKRPPPVQLLIPLSPQGGPLNRQVYAGLRQAILDGTFGAGARLPSTRDLAEQLRISRTVVVLAYEQLLAEGYVVGRGGSGTYVPEGLAAARPAGNDPPADIRLSRFGAYAAQTGSSAAFPQRPASPPRFDFAYGRSDVDCFPFEQWRRILQRRARRTPIRELDYGPATGSEALRAAICEHLKRSRAVACDPSQVIVVNGSQQALDLVARVLIEPGDAIAIEDPSYQGAKEVLRAAGARLQPVAVDRDGLDPARLSDDARMAFVTPSHQFPTGAILPLARRQALLQWARRRNAVIVEDDYDGEFRYQGKPLESLQGLDTEGRVVYVGTFSRTVFSSLRIGYLVVPASLLAAFTAAKWLCDRHTATLEQETLAEFIASGMYERHLRRVRRRNEAARDVLLGAVKKHLGDRVEVTGEGAGAHIVLWPRDDMAEDAIVAAALDRGVGVYGIGGYYLRRPSPAGLLLGYSRMREAEIREGVKRLGAVI
jgi:GntR family transcriptional regulator/MocR family aminotransferase